MTDGPPSQRKVEFFGEFVVLHDHKNVQVGLSFVKPTWQRKKLENILVVSHIDIKQPLTTTN